MSRFRGIIESHKGEPGDEPAPPPAAPDRPTAAAPPTPKPPPSPSPAPPVEPPKRGRPPGKRSDPQFVQATCYVPAALHRSVKIALLQEAQGREFSELVAELLEGWLARKR